MEEKNHFPQPKPAYVDFSRTHLNVQGLILSTAGDALTLTNASVSLLEMPFFFLFLKVVTWLVFDFFCINQVRALGDLFS
jgi:hypothetical protein